MLKLALNNKEYIAAKDYYDDGRINIVLVNKLRDEMLNLTVSLPHCLLLTDVIESDDNNEASFLNHLDGYNYFDVYSELLDQGIILDVDIGEAKSGFNFYKGVLFNEEKIQSMLSIDEMFNTK
ncbi:hypothetical protein [Staphylococcus hyicus]|uniref:hypothetical protein n=1 Tax=Staphylococcus hyicus TaxID=1284 RepID=UPI003132F0A9